MEVTWFAARSNYFAYSLSLFLSLINMFVVAFLLRAVRRHGSLGYYSDDVVNAFSCGKTVVWFMSFSLICFW